MNFNYDKHCKTCHWYEVLLEGDCVVLGCGYCRKTPLPKDTAIIPTWGKFPAVYAGSKCSEFSKKENEMNKHAENLLNLNLPESEEISEAIEQVVAEIERLEAELVESNRIMSADAKQIFKLGEELKAAKAEAEQAKQPKVCGKELLEKHWLKVEYVTDAGQIVDGEWYAPRWGCDTLANMLEDFHPKVCEWTLMAGQYYPGCRPNDTLGARYQQHYCEYCGGKVVVKAPVPKELEERLNPQGEEDLK